MYVIIALAALILFVITLLLPLRKNPPVEAGMDSATAPLVLIRPALERVLDPVMFCRRLRLGKTNDIKGWSVLRNFYGMKNQ